MLKRLNFYFILFLFLVIRSFPFLMMIRYSVVLVWIATCGFCWICASIRYSLIFICVKRIYHKTSYHFDSLSLITYGIHWKCPVAAITVYRVPCKNDMTFSYHKNRMNESENHIYCICSFSIFSYNARCSVTNLFFAMHRHPFWK